MNFIKNKYFWYNVIGAAVAVVITAVLIFKVFDIYGKNGESIPVPDVRGENIDVAKKLLEDKGFLVASIDSVYEVSDDFKYKPGDVVEQLPRVGENVKTARRFYLVIKSKTPPQVEMPNLIDLSLRQAISVLESRGLKLGKAISKPGLPPVMAQYFKGKEITPGTKLLKGSVVDVWVGSGVSDEQVVVPNLIGLTRSEALKALSNSNLNVGSEIFPKGADSTRVLIVRQSPVSSSVTTVNQGSDVDVWYGE